MGMTIWHSSKSDRGQRDMLEAALSAQATDEEWTKKFPKADEDIRWLLHKVNGVAEQRNNAIHAPCSLGIDSGELEIMPIVFFSNLRARKLSGKDILSEFAWYEKSADILKAFTREVASASMNHDRPSSWPDRPQLPTLEQFRRRK